MRNRLHDCVYAFILALLLEISLALICHAETINVTRRTKREVSVEAAPQQRQNANYDAKEMQEVNLKHEKDNGNVEENDTFPRQKREVVRSSLNSVDNDFQRSNVEKSVDGNAVNPNSNENTDYAEEADDEMTRRRERDEDERTSNLVRLSRSADLKYIDQDEGSSLYDDYEAKDVAKRGAEDYEEVEEDSPGVLEDVAAVREEESTADEAERRETRSDVRVKRNQATSGSLDNNVKSSASDLLESEGTRSDGTASELRLDPGSLEESKVAADEPSSRQVSNVELSRGIDEPSLPHHGASNKLEGSASNEAVSSSSSASAEDASAEYEKRAEEQIQRKIDSMKDEIRRDIEAQRRIRDIQENNAKFDELQEEESRSLEGGSIKKHQSVAKRRSIRDVEAVASSKSADKKRSPKGEPREKPQRRSSKSDNDSRDRSSHEKPKRRSAKHRDESSGQSPSKGFFKKKRERARETVLVKKKDRHRTKKRHSRGYALPSTGSGGKLENELASNQELNSYLRGNDETVQASQHLVNEDEGDEEGQLPAKRADSLVSLTDSSQELSPRLAKEYKEAFGGLQSESGNALARFKRVKRVLSDVDAKI